MIWITLGLTYIFEMRRYNLLKKANGLFRVGPMIFWKCYVQILKNSELRLILLFCPHKYLEWEEIP